MIRPLRVVVLSLCSTAAMACGFDSDGLATGSNSAGSLESTAGSETSEGDDNSTTTPATTTTATGPSTMSSTTSDDSTTMPPVTTDPGDSSETGDTASGDSTGPSATSTGPGEESSSEGQGTSSESGTPPANPYGDCDDDRDCGEGTCVQLSLDFVDKFVCYPPCMMTPECPAPDGGDADPLCTNSGCALNCSDGGGGTVSCPDGMECGYTGEGGRRCLWP